MSTRVKQDGMATVTIRLPAEMVNRVDGYAEKKRKELMGAPYTRSDAVRDILREALQNWRVQ